MGSGSVLRTSAWFAAGMRGALFICIWSGLVALAPANAPVQLISLITDTESNESLTEAPTMMPPGSNETENVTTTAWPTTTTVRPDQTGTIIVLVVIVAILFAGCAAYVYMNQEGAEEKDEGAELTQAA